MGVKRSAGKSFVIVNGVCDVLGICALKTRISYSTPRHCDMVNGQPKYTTLKSNKTKFCETYVSTCVKRSSALS